jgi:hypothetical protein
MPIIDFNRDGRPDSPYYDNQLNSVIQDNGFGQLELRTTGGGGGGGDATAANQTTQIGIEEQIRDYIGYESGSSLNQSFVTANNFLDKINTNNKESYEVLALTVTAGSSIDITGYTLLGIVDSATGHCLSIGSVFSIVTGIGGIDNFNANYIQHNPSGAAQLFNFSRSLITGKTLSEQPVVSKVLSGNISLVNVIVVVISNAL